jgi:predicted ribosomally synthesized peptide with SipW-like signal peptide
MTRPRFEPRDRLVLSIALILIAVSLAGVGAFATFTSTASVSQSVTSGTVTIGLGDTGTADNRLDVAATGVVPGDTIQRAVKVSNSGNQDFASISLTTTATTSSLLDTDATNGLQMVIERCSVAWTESGSAPAYTYSCSGTTSTVVSSRAIIGAGVTFGNVLLTAGSTNHLRVTVSLPSTAGNSLQGLTSVISYAFTGTQRAATSK